MLMRGAELLRRPWARDTVPRHMVEAEMVDIGQTLEDEVLSRVYEIGYHISPATKDDEVEKVVSEVRSMIGGAGGAFIAEGAPSLTRLAYMIPVRESGKNMEYDRGYFGWIKFEAPASAAAILAESLKVHPAVMRSILFQTVREETRARFRAPTLREVKRTDTLKAAPHVAEVSAAPLSEAELEKAIEDITTE